MFGLWRKNDGFKWVSYVPTQIVARRRARREKIQQAAAEAKDAARQVARKSVEGLESGVVQAGALAAAGAVHAGHGLDRGARSLGHLATAGLRRLAGAVARAGLVRLAGGLGAVVLAGAMLRIGFYGLDRAGRAALLLGALAAVVAALPAIWRAWGPAFARLALQALTTQRVGAGDTSAGARAFSAARLGTVAVSIALGAAALGGVGWGARWVYSGVMAEAPPVTGTARVVGGQDVKVGGTVYRLAGIAAPEVEQSCGDGGRRWRCGEEARRALTRVAAGKTITCHPRGVDEHGRMLARCLAGTTDIAETLVKGGHVWADQDDSLGYRTLEDGPRTTKIGIWKSASLQPWLYRAKLWDEAKKSAPDGCPIKAEGEGADRVYRQPWDSGYQRLRIGKADLARGRKQWFCSESDARNAGYRPVMARR